MTASSLLPAPNLMPLMRYRELAEAMGWLEQAFGFEKQIAVSDGDGDVIYGQMLYRGSLIMMGAVRDTDLDKLMRQPDEVGGVETQSCYLVVEDADTHYARAQEAGAEVVLELKSDGLGRRGYSCRDPEGHIWNFGTYNPGKGLTMTVAAPAAEATQPAARQRRSPRLLMSLAGLLLALGATCWWFADEIRSDVSKRFADAAGRHSAEQAELAYAELAKVRAEKRKADELAQSAARDLEAERARRLALEAGSGSTSEKLANEQHDRRAAEAAVATLREELGRKQAALDAAIEAKRVSEEKLAVKSASADGPAQGERTAAEAQAQQNAAAASPQADAGASKIETSATTSAPEEEGSKAGDSETASAGGNESGAQSVISDQTRTALRSQRIKASKTRLAAGSRRKWPAYAIDVKHLWPYSSWSE